MFNGNFETKKKCRMRILKQKKKSDVCSYELKKKKKN